MLYRAPILALVVWMLQFLLVCPPAQAWVSADATFPAVRAPHRPALNPLMTDREWKAGRLPEDGGFENLTTRSPAKLATAVYLLYDSRYLYVGFVAHQPGWPITATGHTDNVGFGTDDFVGIGLDPTGTGTRVFYFEVTPAGVRYQQASEDARYRPTWQARTLVQGHTWRAVMRIPLNVLRPRAGVSNWRINAIRSVAAQGDHYTWAFNGLMFDGQQWPAFREARFWPRWTGVRLNHLRDVRPKPRVEVYGLESVGRDRELFAQANGSFQTQSVRTTGIDASIPLTDTINFVATANPDFSNVEVDQQTIAPQEFRLYLQEYRPFFSQGASYINADAAGFGPNTIFYSPSIGPFDRGGKVEGTFGYQSFGVLSFRGFDRTTGNTFDDIAYGYKHALPNRTFLYWADGVFAHHSLAGSDATAQFGAAGRNLKTGFVWGVDNALERGTYVTNGIAHASNGFIDVHKPNYEVNLGYVDLSPTYDPIDGFTQDADLHGFNAFAFLGGPTRRAKNATIFVNADRYFDNSGAVHQADAGVFLNATLRNGLSLNGIGPQIGRLRQYGVPAGPGCSGPIVATTTYSGYPCYLDGATQQYDLMNVPIGWKDGTPTPIDASVSWGIFGASYIHLYTLSTSRPLGHGFSLGLAYDGSYQRSIAGGLLDSQWLRRVSLGWSLARHANLTLALRSINGGGGFAPEQGVNFAAGFHLRLNNGDDLYADYGTPASYVTLNRFIVKYVFRLSGQAGT
ncbi:MAG: DOMON domain-containing protein [Vulcanimicrobiaceae bacterium]